MEKVLTVLDEIKARKIAEVAMLKRKGKIAHYVMEIPNLPEDKRISFYDAVEKGGIITEIKRDSPSNKRAGNPPFREKVIAEEIARMYEAAGGIALSVLTDGPGFDGTIYDLRSASYAVNLPSLRKDFVVDRIQILEAKANRASAILLIVNILEPNQLRDYIQEAEGLGMDCLVETHDLPELEMAIEAGARIFGINNRDLTKPDFPTDIQTSIDLFPYVPIGAPLVSESGIKTYSDIRRLQDAGIETYLIGTELMMAPDITVKMMEYQGRNQKN